MKIAAGLFFTVALLLGSHASAQSDYPSRPIKIIAPVPAGSSADLLARIYSRVLQEKWGQPIVIENRVGASHNIGAGAVWRAAPDGYTIMTAPPPSLAINKYLFPNLTYDPETFVPVTVMVDVPNVLVVRPGLAAKDAKELIAVAKAKPGLITYASTGKGSTLHLAAEAFRLRCCRGKGLFLLQDDGPGEHRGRHQREQHQLHHHARVQHQRQDIDAACGSGQFSAHAFAPVTTAAVAPAE